MFKEILENVRNTCPLIHNITNYVTVNDCANILLACGLRQLWRMMRLRLHKLRKFAEA